MLGAIGSALSGGALGGLVKNGVKALLGGGNKNPLLDLLKNFLGQQDNGATSKILNTALESLLEGNQVTASTKAATNFVKNAL
ncbi:MAG: hypothetical protein KDK66_00395 [Deltaproteobacteria bacterium]|nr:hypothetical protein [Deltaproteobacteria bacterium]